MQISLRFRGPLPRSLWKRFRRRFRQIGASAASVGVFAAASLEPNLSGQWVNRADASDVIELFHVGRTLRGQYPNGATFFEASNTSENTFSATINLVWQEQEVIERCGRRFASTTNLDIEVLEGGADRIRLFYVAGFEIGDSCRDDRSRPVREIYVRK